MNVEAVNLFWTRNGATIVEEGTTYSNVTTDSAQWDEAGSLVGEGSAVSIVQPLGQPLEQPSNSLPSSAVPQLSIGDSWIAAVQQVLFHRLRSLLELKPLVAAVLARGRNASLQATSSR